MSVPSVLFEENKPVITPNPRTIDPSASTTSVHSLRTRDRAPANKHWFSQKGSETYEARMASKAEELAKDPYYSKLRDFSSLTDKNNNNHNSFSSRISTTSNGRLNTMNNMTNSAVNMNGSIDAGLNRQGSIHRMSGQSGMSGISHRTSAYDNSVTTPHDFIIMPGHAYGSPGTDFVQLNGSSKDINTRRRSNDDPFHSSGIPQRQSSFTAMSTVVESPVPLRVQQRVAQHQKQLNKKPSARFDRAFNDTPKKRSELADNIHKTSMIVAEFYTNITIDDKERFIAEISDNVAQRFERFQKDGRNSDQTNICVSLHDNQAMIFGGSTAACYKLIITTHPSLQGAKLNDRNAKILNNGFCYELGILETRGVIVYRTFEDNEVAVGGLTVAAEIEQVERELRELDMDGSVPRSNKTHRSSNANQRTSHSPIRAAGHAAQGKIKTASRKFSMPAMRDLAHGHLHGNGYGHGRTKNHSSIHAGLTEDPPLHRGSDGKDSSEAFSEEPSTGLTSPSMHDSGIAAPHTPMKEKSKEQAKKDEKAEKRVRSKKSFAFFKRSK